MKQHKKLERLLLFSEVAQSLSFTLAAEKLGMMKLLVRRTFSYWRALAVSSSKSGNHLPSRIVSRSVNTYVSVSATLVSNVDPR